MNSEISSFGWWLLLRGSGRESYADSASLCFFEEEARQNSPSSLISRHLSQLLSISFNSAIVVPKETMKINEPLSRKVGKQVASAASQENLCHDVSKKDPCDNASQENLDDDAFEAGLDDDGTSEDGLDDDDDDASEEGSDDDDASSHVYDDEGKNKIPLNQSKPLNDIFLTSGNHGMRCNSLVSETEASNVVNDDAPRQDHVDDDSFEDDKGDDDLSSLALSDSDWVCYVWLNNNSKCKIWGR